MQDITQEQSPGNTDEKPSPLAIRKQEKQTAREILLQALDMPEVQALAFEEPGRPHGPTRLLLVNGSAIDQAADDLEYPKEAAGSLLSNCLSNPVPVLGQTTTYVPRGEETYPIEVYALDHKLYESRFRYDWAAAKYPAYTTLSLRERFRYHPGNVIALLASYRFFLGSVVVVR